MIKRKIKFTKLYINVIVCLFSIFSFSQGINNNWYFGKNAALDFSSGTPMALSGSAMDTNEGVASISDNSGQLLFYTDGRRVWNKNNQLMPNGTSLTSSGRDANQGVVIVPYPNHPNEYFIFTTNGGIPQNGPQYNFMAYSRVDMTLNGGLGDIVDLNTPLEDHLGNTVWQGKVEAITVITNGDSNYWVLMPHRNKLLAYSVDENGVNTTPVQSDIVFVNPTVSSMKVSPNNQFLVINNFLTGVSNLYGFNEVSGQVSNSTPLGSFIIQGGSGNNLNLGIHSTEFSSQSNIIWLSIFSPDNFVYGYDLNNLNAPPIIFSIPISGRLGTLQRGPDEELYLASDLNDYLIRINNSNNINQATLTQNAVYLGGINKSLRGLPQLVSLLSLNSNCLENLILSTPEVNNNFIHTVSNTIITNQNYTVDTNQNITLSAGNFIQIDSNTEIKEGAEFLAEIEGCTEFKLNLNQGKPFKKYINLGSRKSFTDILKLYPNPTNNNITVFIEREVINEIIITSIENKKLIHFRDVMRNQKAIDLTSLKKGIYIISINTKSGVNYYKRIIKN